MTKASPMTKTGTPDELLQLWAERQRANQKANYLMAGKLERKVFWYGVLSATVAGVAGFIVLWMARYDSPVWVRLLAGGLSILSAILGTITRP